MADRTSTVRVQVDAVADRASGVLGKFGKVAGLAALGVAGVAVAGVAGASALYDYADAADDANAKIANVVKTMDLFGGSADEVTGRILDQAKAISLSTAVDLTSIKATQAKLLTFKELAKSAGNVNGQFNRATKAAVDMAALGFGTAETNAVQLGKALNDPIKGITSLTKSGITFTEAEKAKIATMVESGKVSEAQTYILAAIEKQVQGTAAATAGGFELMKNKLSIFGEELAMKALPLMDAFGNFMLEKGIPALSSFASAVGEKAVPLLQQFGGYVQTTILPALQRFGVYVQENVVPALSRLGNFIIERVVPALGELFGWVNDKVVPLLRDNLAKTLEGARGLFDNVAAAVKKNSPELKDMAAQAKKLGEFLLEKVAPVLADLQKNALPLLGTAIGVAIDQISNIYQAFTTLRDIVQATIDKVAALITKLDQLRGKGEAVKGGSGSKNDLPGNTTPSGNNPRAAGGMTVYFTGPVTDPQGTARELERLARRHGIITGARVG